MTVSISGENEKKSVRNSVPDSDKTVKSNNMPDSDSAMKWRCISVPDVYHCKSVLWEVAVPNSDRRSASD